MSTRHPSNDRHEEQGFDISQLNSLKVPNLHEKNASIESDIDLSDETRELLRLLGPTAYDSGRSTLHLETLEENLEGAPSDVLSKIDSLLSEIESNGSHLTERRARPEQYEVQQQEDLRDPSYHPIPSGLYGNSRLATDRNKIAVVGAGVIMTLLLLTHVDGSKVQKNPTVPGQDPNKEKVDPNPPNSTPSNQPSPQRQQIAQKGKTLDGLKNRRVMKEADLRKIEEIAGRLGIDPKWLLAAISFETGGEFSSKTRNRLSGATGLIQFMESTAEGLGTSTAELARMSENRQLDYVEKYLSRFKGRMNSLEDVYMAILWPAAVGKSNNTVIFSSGVTYSQNAGLDINGDHAVTKGEAAAKVRQHYKRLFG